MHSGEITTASHNIHVKHGATAAIRWSTCIRHTSESLTVHTDAETAGHGTVHLLVEVHHVQRIAHLLLMHEHVAAGWILLVNHHIVDADLALPATLLRSHRHVVRLVHRVLVRRALVMAADLTRLSLRVLCLRIRILHDFVHVDLIAHGWWRLRILLSVTIATVVVQVVCILHSGHLVALTVVNVVLAAA